MTGTQVNYFFVCKRKLWLFSNGIEMEHTSDLVTDGKQLHEYSYPRRSDKYEEVALEDIKIDFYDRRDKVIHEVKHSRKLDAAHLWQLKYYIYVFERNGIEGVTGLLEFPKERFTQEVILSDIDREELKEIEKEVDTITHSEVCPPINKKARCTKCAYHDFCYANELGE